MNGNDFILTIDLGTTCAKMACSRAGGVEIIPNQVGQFQSPCAVWLSPQGRLVVGQQARDALSTDSANVQMNFVRDLGSSVEYEFPCTSLRIKPEELTAELLKSLRADAQLRIGRRGCGRSSRRATYFICFGPRLRRHRHGLRKSGDARLPVVATSSLTPIRWFLPKKCFRRMS